MPDRQQTDQNEQRPADETRPKQTPGEAMPGEEHPVTQIMTPGGVRTVSEEEPDPKAAKQAESGRASAKPKSKARKSGAPEIPPTNEEAAEALRRTEFRATDEEGRAVSDPEQSDPKPHPATAVEAAVAAGTVHEALISAVDDGAKEIPDETSGKKRRTVSERVDRLEAAVATRLGINLDELDEEEVVRAREQAAQEAAKKAAALIEKTIADAVKPLTPDQRMERIERLITSALGADLNT